jgi:hypothetical protein
VRINRWAFSVVAVLTATSLEAQASADTTSRLRARVDLATASGYVWRGITRHRYPVVEAFGSIGRAGKVDLDVSAWSSAVTGGCGQPTCAAGSGLHIADVNGSVQGTFALKGTRVSLGANVYNFHPAPYDSVAASATTWEAVASVRAVPSRHLQLALSAWLDLDDVDGFYSELTGTMPISLYKDHQPRLFVTSTVGWNRGQRNVSHGRPVPGYFAKNGFTSASLEVAYLLQRPGEKGLGRSLQIFGRFLGNFDAATKPSTWPFKLSGTEQQIIVGLALFPLLAYSPRME